MARPAEMPAAEIAAAPPRPARTQAIMSCPLDVPSLTAGIRAGNADAFELLYRAWHGRVYGLARAISRRDEAFCLDVSQDVMLRVARRIPVLTCERALGAWLTRCTLRVYRDTCRRERRRTRRDVAHEAIRGAGALSDADVAWLHDQLGACSGLDQELLVTHVVRGATLREAALASGISAGAAHGRLRRALDRIREAAREIMA